MSNFFYKFKKDLDFDIQYFSSVYEIKDIKTLDLIKKSFINSYKINDIDSVNMDHKDFRVYLENKELLVLFHNSEFICFITFDYKPSISGVGLSFYVPAEFDSKSFKSYLEVLIKVFAFIIKEDPEYKYVYFDVASKVIFKWAKEIVPKLKSSKIRDKYIICYTPIDKTYIEETVLKNNEVYLVC